ncbi:MAG: 50S ribosomal protein L16 [Candidatus Moanabacter tarae]|uniref:Large ribosomal subunit protein uL16 n=1 Tax=Candidatus Moanibacter tarae TaxID=2200854 RepID=A0A2Z4AH93_9BACT|nr:MAG: 50S ribosomal protein L16 [Candidatus Moanabacter tarae]|tara:strand:+ start:9046 stop:9465 length:420 start_codon:yes stop_codon:yes gene_type:complete
MALIPSRTKFRKSQRGRVRGRAKRGDQLVFGNFGIQALESGWITAEQIEASRVAVNRDLKRRGKVWIRIFAQKPVSKKPAETRMGKGKGASELWVAVVKAGAILFEVSGASETGARNALQLADGKLPVRCRFISREDSN